MHLDFIPNFPIPVKYLIIIKGFDLCLIKIVKILINKKYLYRLVTHAVNYLLSVKNFKLPCLCHKNYFEDNTERKVMKLLTNFKLVTTISPSPRLVALLIVELVTEKSE